MNQRYIQLIATHIFPWVRVLLDEPNFTSPVHAETSHVRESRGENDSTFPQP